MATMKDNISVKKLKTTTTTQKRETRYLR